MQKFILTNHWKWLLPIFGIIIVAIILFFSTGMGSVVMDITKAYSDTDLYKNALVKVKSNPKAIELLGHIEPIDKLAIFEGSVSYAEDNNQVNSSVRIKGDKLNARMDISAIRVNNEWVYNLIQVRIKKPPEKRQTIKIIPSE